MTREDLEWAVWFSSEDQMIHRLNTQRAPNTDYIRYDQIVEAVRQARNPT